ncbi:hypothetical protein NC651_034278 [Populus alba x Populus x berolinensis]|nr:hypothetical protein NC651_034278 [Populus alba x Populus x berolinensis]
MNGIRILLTTRKQDQQWMLPTKFGLLARNLSEKCKGLRLAIVALAGLMSTKKLEFEWRKINKILNLFLSLDSNCFLYCCVFPEDHMIRRKRFIKLWIAEGFVKMESGARRLSIQVKDREIQSSKGMLSHTRSLFLFPADKTSKPLLSTVFHGFKLLRVWDLENLQIRKTWFRGQFIQFQALELDWKSSGATSQIKLENSGY